MFSCQKEEVKVETLKGENLKKNGEMRTATAYRSYVWKGDKLDCTQAGMGCVVATTSYESNGDVIDLTKKQMLKLIEIGKGDLKEAFLNRLLRVEFPTLYENDYIVNKINLNKIDILFEIPYLTLTDKETGEITIFNYENVIYDTDVIAALKAARGGYEKQMELNTNPCIPAVWLCLSDGNNCAVSASVSYNKAWLLDNLTYLFLPNNEEIINSKIDEDKIIVETIEGNKYGFKF